MDDKEELSLYDLELIGSVREYPLYLSMGRSPVKAVERCFALVQMGYLHLGGDGLVCITLKGKKALMISPTT